jgi:hypothetical protein
MDLSRVIPHACASHVRICDGSNWILMYLSTFDPQLVNLFSSGTILRV